MKAVRSIPANHSLVATLFYLRSIEALDVQCLLPALGAISLGSKPWPNHESAVTIRCENLLLIEIWPPRRIIILRSVEPLDVTALVDILLGVAAG